MTSVRVEWQALNARGWTRTAVFAISVAGVAAACWVVVLQRMSGMGMYAGLGSFSFFIATWAAMMAAMKVPSALPEELSLDRAAGGRRGESAVRSSLVFAVSSLAVWIALGLIAYLADRAMRSAGMGFLAWNSARTV